VAEGDGKRPPHDCLGWRAASLAPHDILLYPVASQSPETPQASGTRLASREKEAPRRNANLPS
jgi:hypothetical protein